MNYRIMPGDTLGKIALRFGTNVGAIVKANPGKITNPNVIFAGSVIRIPGGVTAARAGAAAVNQPKPAPKPAPAGGENHAFERQVVALVNRERAARGLRPLAFDARLDRAAEGHNLRQARTGIMAHQGIGNGTPESRVRGAGWKGGYGENVAYGQHSAAEVMRTWMNSPGHRAAILRPDFTHLAVAFDKSPKNGLPYWTQVFGAK